MSPELKVLHQMKEGNIPLANVARMFADLNRPKRVVLAMLRSGVAELVDDTGKLIPATRHGWVVGEDANWRDDGVYFLHITKAGLARIE